MPHKPRAVVQHFAEVMESKLRANAHKGGRKEWKVEDASWLLERVRDEVKELELAMAEMVELELAMAEMAALRTSPDLDRESRDKAYALVKKDIREEAADIANFAMMVADSLDCLDV